ncbi:MAG: AAA family ATPase [Deltaproteobacteria bacterium]|nr:AAA family ATPase [Deltaproteobacteria bacterium]
MISRIEALHYRCLRYVDQDLGPFQLLVGANATGKTTFLDVVGFLADVVSHGIEGAVQARASTPQDLTWMRIQDRFELSIEARIPDELRGQIEDPGFSHVRYEVSVGMEVEDAGTGIATERVYLRRMDKGQPSRQTGLFPELKKAPQTILLPMRRNRKKQRLVISKVIGGNDNYMPETAKGYSPSFKQSAKRSALGNLPADEASFPVATWLKSYLTEGIQQFVLNSTLMRKASPPGRGRDFKTDGSNLPWVVQNLAEKDPEKLKGWVRHLQTALPDLIDIRTVPREEDKHRYLMLKYQSGLDVPSWLASDGTLRLLALTLPAYLPDFQGTYLIEEPENGIHPRAVEAAFQSLSSVYNAQVLLATHSPVLLSLIKPKDSTKVLCFAKASDGSTDIVSGHLHPSLQAWQGEPNFSVLFAGGVIG